jgi:septum formation protein
MKLVLASTSNFKSNVLKQACIKHIKKESNYIETKQDNENVYEYVKRLSLEKAYSVDINDAIILGLDTVVLVDNKILEKPKSIYEAKDNLRLCSDNTFKVITGITLINKINNETINDYQETIITLNKIDECDIDYYIDNDPNVLYASGFTIETVVSNFINKIEGSFYNILGIPVEKIYEYLLKWNIHLKDLD